ncbi:MAG: molybdenum cofactor guanylyltransferase [Planctomycetota bacterium]
METPPLYILAGGQSKRFGSDKARALAEGRPLLQRVADALRPAVQSCTVVAAEADAYADLGFTTLGDTRRAHGPLGGLETALQHHHAEHGPGWIALASCDLLDPKAEHLAALTARATPDTAAVVYETDRPQPFPGLYHTDALPAVQTGLAEDKPWGMIRLLQSLSAVRVPAPDDWPAIPQANRREHLDAWQADRQGDP